MSFYGWCITAGLVLVTFDVLAVAVWAFLVLVVRPRRSPPYQRTFSVDTRPRP